MERAEQRQSLMCSAIELKGQAPESKLDNGLISNHAYSVTDAKMVEANGVKHHLVR